MRGDPPAVAQPGGGGEEGAAADGRHPAGTGGGAGHPGDEVGVGPGEGRCTGATREQEGVDRVAPGGEPVVGVEGETALAPDRARNGGDHLEGVPGIGSTQVVECGVGAREHLVGTGDVEGLDPGIQRDDDAATRVRHVSTLAPEPAGVNDTIPTISAIGDTLLTDRSRWPPWQTARS